MVSKGLRIEDTKARMLKVVQNAARSGLVSVYFTDNNEHITHIIGKLAFCLVVKRKEKFSSFRITYFPSFKKTFISRETLTSSNFRYFC